MDRLTYIIPNKDHTGGIQSLAHSIRNFIESQQGKVRIFDYSYTAPFFYSLLVRLSPQVFRKNLAERFIFPHFTQKYHEISTNDIVHCWHLDAAMFLPTHSKLIVTVHGLEVLPESINGSWYRRTYYPQVLQHAKYIVCDSSYTQHLLEKQFSLDKKKLLVIYPPINTTEFHPKKKTHSIYTIGTLCRFVKRKNVKNIIEALNILHQRLPNFQFLLAGDGPEKTNILNSLQQAEFQWKYLGKISDQEKKNEFYPILDVFVMPTLVAKHDVEGFGIVYLEANASGVPVVAAKSGGATEAVSEIKSGLFANPKDPADIAKKIQIILTEKRFSSKDTVSWAKQFDMTVAGQQYQKLYKLL